MKTLVAVFSASGVTKRVGEEIARVSSGDFFEIVPFCTSSSSGIGMSGKNLEANAGSGNWLDGERFGGGVTEEELQAWIDGLQ